MDRTNAYYYAWVVIIRSSIVNYSSKTAAAVFKRFRVSILLTRNFRTFSRRRVFEHNTQFKYLFFFYFAPIKCIIIMYRYSYNIQYFPPVTSADSRRIA